MPPSGIVPLAVPTRTPLVIAALFGVWAAALLLGLVFDSSVGGIFGLVLLAGLAGYTAWQHRMNTDPATVALGLMASSIFIPAGVGPSLLGLSLDDLPLLIGTLLGAALVIKDGWRRLLVRPAFPLFAFALWAGLSSVLVGAPAEALAAGLGRFGLYALALAVAFRLCQQDDNARFLIAAIIVVGLAEALFALWAYFLQFQVGDLFIGISPMMPWEELLDVVPGRTVGTTGLASNFLGAFMLFPTALALGEFTESRLSVHRVAYAGVFLACGFTLVFTLTRASMITLGIALVVIVAVTRRLSPAVLVVAFVAAVLVLTPVAQRFDDPHDRFILTEQGLEAVENAPGLGLGSGQYGNPANDPDLDDSEGEEAPVTVTPHNSFLVAAAETGIVGGVLLLVGAITPAAYLALGKRNRSPLVLAIIAALLAFGIHNGSNNLFHIPTVATYYWLTAAAGLAMVTAPRERSTERYVV
jgi:hypothetical protein